MFIYHIVKEQEYKDNQKEQIYKPESLDQVGFVHCSMESSVIPIANDYFGNIEEQLLLLRIDPQKLISETKYEEAIPEKDVNTSYISSAQVFPHIYGPINLSAINGIGKLKKDPSGYIWHDKFVASEDNS
jgi:uncharacterized protein (DUF952 family)